MLLVHMQPPCEDHLVAKTQLSVRGWTRWQLFDNFAEWACCGPILEQKAATCTRPYARGKPHDNIAEES